MGNYDNSKNRLYNQCQIFKKGLDLLIKDIEENKQTNEQFFLEFLDYLNLTSVKY